MAAPQHLLTVRVKTVPTTVFEEKRQAALVPVETSGEAFPIDAPQAVVGRAEDTDLHLADALASRYHAKVIAVHNLYYVQDLGSTNGTFLNDTQVNFERLAHGDTLRIGGSRFRFVVSDALDESYHLKLDLGTVTALALAVEAKDPYTKGHSERVADGSERLAMALGVGAEEARRIRTAGLLHDIGKIGVPEAILRKRGKLEDGEFMLIRRHPDAGATILRPLGFLADLLPVVRHHHERFDGTGYPDGLGGEDLPLGARIVQLIDTFDAMASSRPYRQGLAPEVVRTEIQRCAGSQFDPVAAEAFLDLFDALVGEFFERAPEDA